MKLKQLTIALITVSIALVFGPQAARAASLTTLADGLNNARGLSFDSDGNAYIGETGLGGDGVCQPSPSTQFELICSGNTGSVTKVTPDGTQSRVIDGTESLALQQTKEQGAGPQELNFDSSGNAYLLTGFAGNPANRDAELNALSTNIQFPSQQQQAAPPVAPDQVLGTTTLGKLYKTDLNTGSLTEVADLSKAELTSNPDGGDVISNPYDFVIKDNTAYIGDGGANVIWNVNLDSGETKATKIPGQTLENPEFPPNVSIPGAGQEQPPAGQQGQDAIPGVPAEQEASGPPAGQIPSQVDIQSVVTGVDIGPDGAVYAGELTGFPYPEGKAKVWRIGENGEPEVFAEGFTQITDIKFDRDGNLLVLQFADEAQWKGGGQSLQDLPGSLIKLAPDGTRTTLVAAGEGLASAAGLNIGPDGEIYVVNNGVGPGTGELVRVDGVGSAAAVPEPSSILGLLLFGVMGGGTWFKRKQQQDREANALRASFSNAPEPAQTLSQSSI
ncbi:ScyD/ScyE family protein [Cyanosarcina cf. burmensis CCALA 770]|nr:ScyD/ScyE family protein [Cyanosarcina cf. burmensis CCALA 770]